MEAAEVERALAATTSDASSLGLDADQVIVIQNANRLAVRLLPCDVLARVAPPTLRSHEVAVFEVEMARRLGAVDCPVGRLEPRVEPAVRVRDGFAITHWTYYEPASGTATTPAEYARALEDLHRGMRLVESPAPHFTARVDEAREIIGDRSLSPDLAPEDRSLLATALGHLRKAVLASNADEQLLHGEPHEGNLLQTTSGLRFIDLETCCRGPVELDIAHLPRGVDRHYGIADQRLVRDCRLLALSMVAAWRAHRDDAYPNGAAMLDHLVTMIRRALDRRGIDPER